MDKIFTSTNLKYAGYFFSILGLVTLIRGLFSANDVNAEPTADLKVNALSNQGSFNTGILMLGLGLVLISVNK